MAKKGDRGGSRGDKKDKKRIYMSVSKDKKTTGAKSAGAGTKTKISETAKSVVKGSYQPTTASGRPWLSDIRLKPRITHWRQANASARKRYYRHLKSQS